jgi:hypothetical protein
VLLSLAGPGLAQGEFRKVGPARTKTEITTTGSKALFSAGGDGRWRGASGQIDTEAANQERPKISRKIVVGQQ